MRVKSMAIGTFPRYRTRSRANSMVPGAIENSSASSMAVGGIEQAVLHELVERFAQGHARDVEVMRFTAWIHSGSG